MYPQRSVMTCGLATALEPPHFNHAPAWGATRLSDKWVTGMMGFNPRTRVGCDEGAADTDWTVIQFQSTHPRGVRRAKRYPMARC